MCTTILDWSYLRKKLLSFLVSRPDDLSCCNTMVVSQILLCLLETARQLCDWFPSSEVDYPVHSESRAVDFRKRRCKASVKAMGGNYTIQR